MLDYIQNLPKAELHCHIEGTLEPELLFKLAKKNDISLPYQHIEQIKAAYEFNDLQSFLDLYYQGSRVLIAEEDFYQLTWQYLQKAAQQNIKHTEIFFDPQTHTQRGIAFDTVFNGIHRALTDAQTQLEISSQLILCFLRDLSEEQAFETLEQALPYKQHIIAVGLDSAETGHPPRKFARVFSQARTEGFKAVAHAGEEGPADYIWEAIELLKVSRIDHGIRCLEDPLLVNYLQKQQIPLTVCPLSNVKLKGVPSMTHHPIRKLFDAGLCVTINSDDPAYFGGYINENYSAIQQTHGFTEMELKQLADNSFKASFNRE